MSTSAEDETLPDKRENILGSPESIPILSSSKPWRNSQSFVIGKEFQSGAPRVPEEKGHGINESEDEVNEIAGETSESENGASKLGSSRERPKGDLDSWVRRNERHYFWKASLESYRSLLDQKERSSDACKPNTVTEDDSTVSTKIGLVEWTRGEESRLFAAVSRRGKSRTYEIAQDLGSKSKLEVLEYIQLLEDAAKDEILQRMQTSEEKEEKKQQQPPLAMAIPAAVDVNEELEKALDIIAEHISILEQRMDDLEGKKIHGSDFWTIDSNVAEKIEGILESRSKTPSESQSKIFQSAGLLSIRQWIRLSERLFMNAGESQFEDNWRNVAFEGESPSLTADAFCDFYTLTRDITKRLVAKSFSVAHDRVAGSKRTTAPVVRKEDVVEAAEILHMKRNPFHFYIHLARRLRLDVADIVNKKGAQGHNEYLSYHEVEKKLSQETSSRAHAKSSTRDQKSRHIADAAGVNGLDSDEDGFQKSLTPDEEEDSEMDRDGGQLGGNREETNSSTSDDGTFFSDTSLLEDSEISELEQIEYDRKVDEYLDFFDRKSSKQAEAELRALFRENGFQFNVNTEEDASEPPPVPTKQTLREHAIIDWRTDLVYRTEWGSNGTDLRMDGQQVQNKQRKRRRIE
ncbi:hypothetical protein UA08_03069 [Talaromyces atroroseus]|uniref:Myb-like domain-containing protein n=1 Tax=Talaromyces atroroseus TaxID=1441469 RepID=A0A225ATP3_TALAT|nr:hypothetical protein UA08_03069 [Talaromyces atroroseus]OKL61734.1 hypothetical protein UA08_03069 [Talaromyces atroroseus]